MKDFKIEIKLFNLSFFSFEVSRNKKEKDKNEESSQLSNHQNLMQSNPINNGKIRPDLKELEKKVFNQEEVPKPIKVKCTTCNGTTYDDDIDFCIKCSKEICSNCGSVDTDGKKYCTECWIKL